MSRLKTAILAAGALVLSVLVSYTEGTQEACAYEAWMNGAYQ